MDYVALQSEIVDDPINMGFASWVASGHDGLIADQLNIKQFRGPVPIVELSSYCVRSGLIGVCEIAASMTELPMEIRAVCITVTTLMRDDFRLTTCDTDDPAFGAACVGLIQAGLMSEEQQNTMIALGENRYSRAEVILGSGVRVTPDDVAKALRG